MNMWRFLGVIFWQTACAAVFAFLAFQFVNDLDAILVALVGALVGGLVWLFVNFNRSRRYLDWLRAGDLSDAPKLMGVWGEATDRTRRLLKVQTRDLQVSNQRLDDFLAAIQASPNGVVLLDKNGQIEWCNLTAASHFGLNPTADISQHMGNLVRDPDFATYFASGDYANEVTITGQNRVTNRSTRLAVHVHPYGQGKKLLLSNDVTAIEAAEFMRRDFVANVSHEIRTPLTVLSGFVETLQTLDLDEVERAKYLDLMQQQSLRMHSLVSDLLTLSKLEGSPAPMTDVWINVNELVATCELEANALKAELHGKLHSTDVAANEKEVLFFDIQPDLQLAGSQSELLSAMCNLVNNAIRYTSANGKIRVSFQALDRGGAVFSVNDSGLGIPPEHLPRLTERFYRVDTSRSRETGGTGLGLSIVKHVVQRHGGELQISSTLGKGSTFCFTLPEYRVRFKKNIVASSA
jgi:two-component system, OmpR family, phosphate regulon sensor histidine kinase PhoR